MAIDNFVSLVPPMAQVAEAHMDSDLIFAEATLIRHR